MNGGKGGRQRRKEAGNYTVGFYPGSLASALKEVRVRELELKHREGYKRKPVRRDEFSGWESERIWGD